MDGLIGQSDGAIRLAVFLGVFLVMALIELGWPKRALSVSKRRRWLTNLGISVTDSIVLRLMAMLAVPVAAIAAAFYAEAHGIGLLNQVAWPDWLKVVVALLVLDLAIWAQHLASHKVPLFWRLHQVHHADRDIDVTTAVRFHPVEIALSMLWKIVVVVPLGAPPLAVFLFEVILNACAMFNHANIALPARARWRPCACSSSRPTCTACITRCSGASTIPITASISRSGTGCSAPTPRSRRTAIRA